MQHHIQIKTKKVYEKTTKEVTNNILKFLFLHENMKDCMIAMTVIIISLQILKSQISSKMYSHCPV
jgi:hypothetical protein